MVCPPSPAGKLTSIHFLFCSRAGRRQAATQRKTQQRKQPARVKVERNANALVNKEEVPPMKKMRMYVILLFGVGKRDTTVFLEGFSAWLRGFLQEG